MTNAKLEKFIKTHMFPGFYIDVCGMYCLCLGKYLISVFLNSDTNELDVCVDSLSKRGMYEDNLEWETPSTEDELAKTICRFVKKYSNKI